MQTGSGRDGPDRDHAVYAISVAASLVGTGMQNLRAYEKAGLVEPSRTAGGSRLYSQDDIERLRRIDALLRAGLNLAGIAMVLALEEEIAGLRDQLPPRPDGRRSRSRGGSPRR